MDATGDHPEKQWAWGVSGHEVEGGGGPVGKSLCYGFPRRNG